jgi:hypothetical protein
MAESLFKANPNLPSLAKRYETRAQRAIDRIWVALQRWAQQWARAASAVTPVSHKRSKNDPVIPGTLKRSYFVVPIRNGMHLTVILANHQTYGKWLAFGTRFIAHGHVLAWTYGQPVIRNWPAKAATLPYPKRPTEKSLARWNERMGRAMSPGGEELPIVRPVGLSLMPDIIREVQAIIAQEFGRAA